MNQERILKVLLSPHITEKTTNLGEKHKQIAFKVLRDATKLEIKAAVEKLFNVKVKAVTVSNKKAETKRFGSTLGTRKAWKKAYISLQEGFDINFAGGGSEKL